MSQRVIRFPRPVVEPTADGGWVARFEPLGIEVKGTTSRDAERAIVDEIARRMGALERHGVEALALVHGEELDPIPDGACVVDLVEGREANS